MAQGGNLVDYVYAGGKMIAKVSSGSTQYFISDRLSVRMTVDSSGNVNGRQAHLPFGEDFAESGNQDKHHFTNYERDGESGLDYAVNRYHSSNVGRFSSIDPVTGRIDNPQGLNRYSYAQNDPINLVDPDGRLFGIVLSPSLIDAISDYFGSRIVLSTTEGFLPELGGGGGGGGGFTGGPVPIESPEPGGGAGGEPELPQQPDPCEILRAAARAEVDALLAKSGLDQFIQDKRISESGKGYILAFSSLSAAKAYVETSGFFTGGGSFGAKFHIKELKRLGDPGPFSDFRSFTGSSGLADRSLQVVFGSQRGYVDTDKFNYRQDLVGLFGHIFGEVTPFLVKKILKRKIC